MKNFFRKGDRVEGGTRTPPGKISKKKGGCDFVGRKSKRDIILEEALAHKDFERKRINEILKSLGTYTPALHPLIEMYLDACEVYYIKYAEWKTAGFKATKIHKNKSGAKNEIKHPLAQQVEVWNDKKTKLLSQLGLDSKNKNLFNVGPLISENPKEKKNEEPAPTNDNKLIKFKEMTGKK